MFFVIVFPPTKTQQTAANIIFFSYRSQDSEVEGDNGDLQIASDGVSEAQLALTEFWPKVMEEIKKITTVREPFSSGIDCRIKRDTYNFPTDGLENTIFTAGQDKENHEARRRRKDDKRRGSDVVFQSG